MRAELYLSQFALDIRYRAGKKNIVSNAPSRLIYLKHDSNLLSENKNIFEDVFNEYYCYSATVIEISDDFKNNIRKEYDNENR
jgi:hypothetical protein